MEEERSAGQVSWGARINTRERHDVKDCPAWVKGADRERWTRRGVTVWQGETQHIIRLSATHAVQLLGDLRTDDEWPEEGITICEPVTYIPMEGADRKPRTALHNPIHLSPRQTKSLLRLLERNEARLTEMSEEEIEKGSRALGRAYRLILEYGERSKAGEPGPEGGHLRGGPQPLAGTLRQKIPAHRADAIPLLAKPAQGQTQSGSQPTSPGSPVHRGGSKDCSTHDVEGRSIHRPASPTPHPPE